MTAGPGELRRQLGVGDAVVVGAGSMVGAGVFVVWGPAAEIAGTGLLIGLAIAAIVAVCNAMSSAQLAAVHPQSGGTYVYGRARLGPGWGHLAGWGFVVGKTASCAAMALTVGAYVWPERERVVAVAAVVAITAVNLGGLTRTVGVTRLLLAVSLVALGAVVVAGWTRGDPDLGRLTPIDAGPLDVLRSAGFMFFAFAGYARIATLGEEVRDPETTIPTAIPRALGAVLALYALVAVTALVVVPIDVLAVSAAPLQAVVDASGLTAIGPVVRAGAGIAALGVLLNLIPGVSRTTLAMARNAELPGALAHVDRTRSTPVRAELTVASVVVLLVVTVDLRDAIGFSSMTVLTYYAITNAATWTLPRHLRRWPSWVSVLGFVGCVVLALTLPATSVATGIAVLATGIAVRWLTERRRAGARRG